MERSVRVLITGKVQGVFFRQSLAVIARRNGVNGWTRNLPDGRVEALLQGDKDAVGRVIKWCKTGPANSRVYGVDIEQARPVKSQTFDVRY